MNFISNRLVAVSRKSIAFAILSIALSLFSSFTLANGNFPPGFISQRVIGSLDQPTAIDFAQGNRIFIAYKDGRVRVAVDEVLIDGIFADYRAQVNTVLDRGLLGLAVHPEFPDVPYIYLAFTHDPPEAASGQGLAGQDELGNRVSKVVRLEADPALDFNRMLPGSEVILIGKNSVWDNIGAPDRNYLPDSNGVDIPPSCDDNGTPVVDCLPQDSNTHSVGDLRFGLDGSLYFSVGEGARAAGGTTDIALRAQSVDSLAGKLIRINPLNGEGYATNPFFDGDFDSNRSKIWGVGLRNPFRMTVEPGSGEIFIGDVGWGQWEEVNVAGVNAGGGLNFGWPCFEGDDSGSQIQGAYSFTQGCIDLLAGGLEANVTAPAFAYAHTGGAGSSIQMGDFYTGSVWPGQYQNALFYSDINRQIIRYLSFDGAGNVSADNAFADSARGIAQIRSGPDSNLYYVDVYAGEIRRILYTAGGNAPPTAEFDASPLSGGAPLTVDFDASESFDPDVDPLTYNWTFGDGNTGTGVEVSHTYVAGGDYTAVLRVSDTSGATNADSKVISAGNAAPTATINSITNSGGGTNFVIGDTIIASGGGSDPEDGALPGTALQWNVRLMHNDHFHLDYFNGEGSTVTMPFLDHEDNSRLEVCLTAVDSGELSDTTCQIINPQTISLTINSSPGGLQIAYGTGFQTTPFTVNAPVGATRTLGAALTQGANEFLSWSNGGDAAQDYLVPANNTTLVATYTQSPGDATLSVADASVAENAGPGQFVVSLNRASASTVTVRAAAVRLSATPGQDHYGFFRILEFAPGETSKTINVTVIDDNTPEPSELVGVRLYRATNAVLGNTSAELTIIDNDTGGQSSLSVSDTSVGEGAGVGQFIVTLDPPNTSQTVSVIAAATTISATPGADYYGFSVPLTFTPGQTTRTVDVTILDDSQIEAAERIGVRLLRPTNAVVGDGLAEMTIVDNDSASTPELSILDATVSEGDVAAVTVRLSQAVSVPVEVTTFTRPGTATPGPGEDFFGQTTRITFAPGQTVNTVNVVTLEDTRVEGNENFSLFLSSPSNARIGDGSATVVITDDDSSGNVTVNIGSTTVTEGTDSEATVAVSLSAASSVPVQVEVASRQGTAISGPDYSGRNYNLTFAPGETVKTVSWRITDDSQAESTESFRTVVLSANNAIIGSEGTVTINDDD